MVTPVAMEPMLGYHPCSTGFLTSSRDPAGGQCQAGSLAPVTPWELGVPKAGEATARSQPSKARPMTGVKS